MVLADWMDRGEAPIDLWDVDIRIMQPFQANRSYLQSRVSETLGLLYADHFPYRQFASARGVRRSPIQLPQNRRCMFWRNLWLGTGQLVFAKEERCRKKSGV